MTSSSSFTCASCQVVFQSSEQQRDHYRSEWHRYNLRRKTSELPPVTEQIFNQRLTNMITTSKTKEMAVEESQQARECMACKKVFSSEKSFENHVRSKKHLEAVANFSDSEMGQLVRKVDKTTLKDREPSPTTLMMMSNLDEAQTEAALKAHLESAKHLEVEECIFCPHKAESFEANIQHMTIEHSLYIPDLQFVKDLRGLIKYLGEKVSIGFTCLYCPASIQPFRSLPSVRKHMRDKGHCKIRFDDTGFDELSEFYDYSSSYPVVEDDGDEEFEDVDTDEEGDYLPSPDVAVLSPDGTELILPDGRTIGHRAYRIYYKQNLHSSVIRESRERELVAQMVNDYSASGQLVLSHLPTPKSRFDQKAENDARKERALYMGLKGNGLMKHFRQQLLQ